MRYFLFSIPLLVLAPDLAAQKALFLVAGQSNSVGQGDAAASIEIVPGSGLEYRQTGDTLVHLKDPVGESANGFQSAGSGSAWPAFARRFHALSGKQVVIAAAARGGSSAHPAAELNDMGTWAETGKRPLLDRAVKKLKEAEMKAGKRADGIIWIQGERDANAIFDKQITPEDYQLALASVITRFRAALGHQIPFYIVLTGNQAGREPSGNQAVREAQNRVADKLSKVFIVYKSAAGFSDRGLMKDFVHYNQTALNEIGTQVAEKIVSLNQ